MVLILKKYFQEVSIHIKRIIQRGERDMNMSDLIGREVKIGDKEGEITNVLGIGYEVTFFNVVDGRVFIDARDIYDYLV